MRSVSRQKTTKHPAMKPKHPAHPGIELDGHGDVIPMQERLPEDRAKAHSAAKKKRKSKPKSKKRN